MARSPLPTDYHVTPSLGPLQTQATIRAADTFLDPHQTTTVHRTGADTLERRTTALAGRSLPDLVSTQPGWLLEANGILHPRDVRNLADRLTVINFAGLFSGTALAPPRSVAVRLRADF